MVREEIIINKEGIREDLLSWNIKEVIALASQYERAFNILLDLLNDKNPLVRTNALQAIKEMVSKGLLKDKKIPEVVNKVVELARDKNERVSLKALELLNILLEKGELREEDYTKITDALMDILKRGTPILSEYASEGLGKAGSKVLKIARRLIGWLFSLIRSSEDRQVQSAAITALTEMAYQTDNKEIFNEIFDKMTDLLEHVDPYIQERALSAVERMSSKADMLTKRNRIKAIKKIRDIQENVRLASKASLLLEKLEKMGYDEEVLTQEEVRKRLEISEYGPDDVERLLDAGKTDIVAELAKMDPIVMSMILDMLNSEDPTRRMDALWVISKVVPQLTPTDAYSVLPILAEFLKSRNPWVRRTAAETLAEIYSLYPGTAQFFTSLLDVLLKSSREEDIEGALELIYAIKHRLPTPEFDSAMTQIIGELLLRDETRPTTLRFLARESQSLLDFSVESLMGLMEILKKTYGKDGGKYDNIIASLIDLIEDILKLKEGNSKS